MDRTSEVINLIMRLEGVKLKAYLDSAGIPTIGIGTTKYPSGEVVKMGDKTDIWKAKNYLQCYLNVHVFPLLRDYHVPDSIYVALSSFIYNVGHLGPSLIQAIKDKNWNELADAFRKYDEVDGKVVNGLKNRREIEVKYMLGGM